MRRTGPWTFRRALGPCCCRLPGRRDGWACYSHTPSTKAREGGAEASRPLRAPEQIERTTTHATPQRHRSRGATKGIANRGINLDQLRLRVLRVGRGACGGTTMTTWRPQLRSSDMLCARSLQRALQGGSAAGARFHCMSMIQHMPCEPSTLSSDLSHGKQAPCATAGLLPIRGRAARAAVARSRGREPVALRSSPRCCRLTTWCAPPRLPRPRPAAQRSAALGRP